MQCEGVLTLIWTKVCGLWASFDVCIVIVYRFREYKDGHASGEDRPFDKGNIHEKCSSHSLSDGTLFLIFRKCVFYLFFLIILLNIFTVSLYP